MTRTILLKRLRAFTEEVTADLIMPTRLQKGDTEQIFSMPKDKRTEDYITGRFG